MKVWIIAHFVLFPGEPGINRFHYLASLLSDLGHEVTLFTSKFSHKEKKNRSLSEIKNKVNYKIELIDEPKYLNNLSLKRVIAHKKFSQNLSKVLKKVDDFPSVILLAFPSISCAITVSNFAVKNRIPYIVDVQDWWPDAFEIALKNVAMRRVFKFLIKPIKKYLIKVFSDASAIVAVSESYLENALSLSKNASNQLKEVIPLGVDLKKFDLISSKYSKNDNKFKLVYVGQVGQNYDLETVIKAIPILRKKIPNLFVDIVGDGDKLDKLKELSFRAACDDIINFTGFIPYEKMVKYLIEADVALNTIKQEWIFLPNKVFDYCAAGLPIVNSIKADFGFYVNKYKIGINYTAENIHEFVLAVEELWADPIKRKEFGENSRKFVENFGDREKNYRKLVGILEKAAKKVN